MTPNELDFSFLTPNDCAKFHQILFKIATVGAMTDTQTHRQIDASDLIICPMLCYSNGTDNNICLMQLMQKTTIKSQNQRAQKPHIKNYKQPHISNDCCTLWVAGQRSMCIKRIKTALTTPCPGKNGSPKQNAVQCAVYDTIQ